MNLPRRQQELYDTLVGKGDVAIIDIFKAMNEGRSAPDVRSAQQWLGPFITRLNRRLKDRGVKVAPGHMKNTYALTVIK